MRLFFQAKKSIPQTRAVIFWKFDYKQNNHAVNFLKYKINTSDRADGAVILYKIDYRDKTRAVIFSDKKKWLLQIHVIIFLKVPIIRGNSRAVIFQIKKSIPQTRANIFWKCDFKQNNRAANFLKTKSIPQTVRLFYMSSIIGE